MPINRVDCGPCLAVDLTPALPGGEAGGANVLAFDLVARIRRLAPHYRLLLLTSSVNHDVIGALFGDGVERLQMIPGVPALAPKALAVVNRVLSGSSSTRFGAVAQAVANTIQWLMARIWRREHRPSSLRERNVSLLFCPFTAPTYAEPGIRVVSILYDLQHLKYPQFFAPQEVKGRNTHLRWLRRSSDMVVCISEYSRETLLRHLDYPPERTRVVPIAIHDRLRSVSSGEVRALQTRLGLGREYVVYPANAWPHKNHRLLLAAFGLMRSRNPHLDVDLVFTGALGAGRDDLAIAARRMGLESRIHWVGYCTTDELAALYQGCRMLVFPSLYEGFGIPLLEAMWFGKPVACSDTTSLPEVGGDAVRYFDPRRPEDIATAMAEVLADTALAADLVARGHRRVIAFDGDAMASAYLRMFDELLRESSPPADMAVGVFADGWTGGVVRLAHAGGAHRTLELDLEVPAWMPHAVVSVSLKEAPREPGRRWHVPRGRRETFRFELPLEAGHLLLEFSPLFRPKEHGIGNDARPLGCLCHSIHISNRDGRGVNLVIAGGDES